jgi:methylenetetrahydrofolate dehydrogenase (NADP+)/methenyltetrahydrofolate cyclohydrolase
MAIYFDGYAVAAQQELHLKEKAARLRASGLSARIQAILFEEDRASQIYTQLKKEAAQRIGIDYQVSAFSFLDPIEKIQAAIQEASADPAITGIIIQKPWTQKWLESQPATVSAKTAADFAIWWQALVEKIATKNNQGVNKDVDGLHPQTLAAIEAGTWRDQGMLLPATVRAVLSTFKWYRENQQADFCPSCERVLILGRSDLLGRPLYYQLRNEQTGRFPCRIREAWQNNDPMLDQSHSAEFRQEKLKKCEIKLFGKKQLNEYIEQKKSLKDFSLIIAATGQRNLIQPAMIADGVMLIDVGEPAPDIDPDCAIKASFLTPVPGGIGPMTVQSLMANALNLLEQEQK